VLRKRLILALSPLVILLTITAVAAIWTLQSFIESLHAMDSQSWTSIEPTVSHFRWVVLALAAVFLILINLSIFAFLRTAGMVLRPVEKLIEATRELGQEHFDHRVQLDHEDEFAELARAYNHMAGQLQCSEQRQLDTLQRVALTLNHELNNALATIELQLQLLNRKGNTVESARKCAGQIREGLARMGATVEALKHVRRIVLTDYLPGVKMLDLEQSVRETDDVRESDEVLVHP